MPTKASRDGIQILQWCSSMSVKKKNPENQKPKHFSQFVFTDHNLEQGCQPACDSLAETHKNHTENLPQAVTFIISSTIHSEICQSPLGYKTHHIKKYRYSW